MLIGKGIEMLEISATIMGRQETIYPTLIWDSENVILVDAGYPGQLPLFHVEMEKAGVPLDRLTQVIVTHQDIDHIGSLSMILKECSEKVEVLANEVEKPYIQGDIRLIKITDEAIVQAMKALPDHVSDEFRAGFKRTLENPPSARVDKTIDGEDELPFCGGVVVINTPGHTPGHISLYHKQSKTLIAGDAMMVADGELLIADPQYCEDASLALESLKRFIAYDIETVICYHGGLYKGNVNKRIAELVKDRV
jgi:glyoxylase-like metal-dependent hydrolase (beta-lactamase superfamily II)